MPFRSMFSSPRILVICACLALAASSSVALASGGGKTKVSIDPGRIGSATASCPQGKGVIAGGFNSPGFSPGNNQAAVARIGSQRTGTRKLETTAYNFGDQSGKIVSLAYCSKGGRGVKVAHEKVFVPPASAAAAIATCPGDSKAVAGGFASPGFSASSTPRVLAITSKRSGPHQWRVEAFNMGADNGNSSDPRPGTLISYAYCLENAPKVVVRHRRVAAGVRGAVKSFDVSCPQGMLALSGGFDGNVYLSANATAAGTVVSRRTQHGRAWGLSAVSISERSAKVTGYAYCVPRRH